MKCRCLGNREEGSGRKSSFNSQHHCVQSQSFFWVAGSVKPMAYNYRSSMTFKGKQITAACEGGSLIRAIYLCSDLPISLKYSRVPLGDLPLDNWEFWGVFLVTDWAN